MSAHTMFYFVEKEELQTFSLAVVTTEGCKLIRCVQTEEMPRAKVLQGVLVEVHYDELPCLIDLGFRFGHLQRIMDNAQMFPILEIF